MYEINDSKILKMLDLTFKNVLTRLYTLDKNGF